MNKLKTTILDMDGTLYGFPESKTFTQIPFGKTIWSNMERFIATEFGLDEAAAKAKLEEFNALFEGEISLGLEREFGIDRMRFFGATWNLDVESFVEPNGDLPGVLNKINTEVNLLSAAPRVWVDKVLGFLSIREVFGDKIFTGEPDIRKPNPEVFRQIVTANGVDPRSAISIGDQEHTDILPAKSIGMLTMRIAPDGTESSADFVASDIASAIELLQKEGLF